LINLPCLDGYNAIKLTHSAGLMNSLNLSDMVAISYQCLVTK